MNLETVSASEDETSVVTEQEETQDTEAFTSETDAQQTETELSLIHISEPTRP